MMHSPSSIRKTSHWMLVLALLCHGFFSSCAAPPETAVTYVDQVKCKPLARSKLLVELPAICPTPDGMTLDRDGNIIVACPNYGDPTHPAVLHHALSHHPTMRAGRVDAAVSALSQPSRPLTRFAPYSPYHLDQ